MMLGTVRPAADQLHASREGSLHARAAVRHSRPPVALDLEEVALVEVAAVRFLSACEADGIELLYCAQYKSDAPTGDVKLPTAERVSRKIRGLPGMAVLYS
jgi:hypothetical protein